MKMLDIDYDQFMRRLKTASEKGEKIERKDKVRWKAYVREHGVYEAAGKMHAEAVSDAIEAAIIDSEDDWNGYYFFSKRDVVCLKFQRKG